MSIINFIKRHPVLIYFIMAFAFSWGLIIIMAGPGNIPLDTEQSKELLPLLYTLMLVGPSISGVLLIGIVNGKAGFLSLRSRLFKWRVGVRWYVVALLTTPILASVVLLVLSLMSPEFNFGIFKSDEKTSLLLSGILTGLLVGIFEEVGWSGFVVPNLRLRYNILITGLIVGLLWGAWHFILFWERDSFYGTLPLLILLGRLFAWLPPFRVLMVWIYDRTGSLLIVILTHASLVFTVTILVPMTITGKNLIIWILVWGAVQWVIILAIVVFNSKGFLKQPQKLKNNLNNCNL
jgi:membrane protease YdiL (CAAX protease family)